MSTFYRETQLANGVFTPRMAAEMLAKQEVSRHHDQIREVGLCGINDGGSDGGSWLENTSRA